VECGSYIKPYMLGESLGDIKKKKGCRKEHELYMN
jgi:hypothetical protein